MNGIYWNDILKVTYLFYLTNYKLQLKKQQQRDQKLSQQPWSTRNIFEKKKQKQVKCKEVLQGYVYAPNLFVFFLVRLGR
jgi:hypothetical protein